MEQLRKQHTTNPRTEEVIEDLPTPATTEVDGAVTDALLDGIDTVIEDAEATSDAVLLDMASQERVATVKRTGRSAFQSHNARAWTRGGQVD